MALGPLLWNGIFLGCSALGLMPGEWAWIGIKATYTLAGFWFLAMLGIGARVTGLVLGVALLALSLGGCATSEDAAKYARADEALRRNPVFVRDYNACVRSDGFDRGGNYPTDLLGWGTTRDASFFQCMERAGWVQSPRWNPAAIGRYERRP